MQVEEQKETVKVGKVTLQKLPYKKVGQQQSASCFVATRELSSGPARSRPQKIPNKLPVFGQMNSDSPTFEPGRARVSSFADLAIQNSTRQPEAPPEQKGAMQIIDASDPLLL